MKNFLVAAIFAIPVTIALAANDGNPSASTISEPAAAPSLWERDTLTGDWFGASPTMRDHGVNLTASLTQFYQGLLAGDDPDDWEYGGKLDMFLRLDGGKLGLWDGLGLNSHFELLYGHANPNPSGVLLPVNSAMYFPTPNETVGDLSLYLSQQIGEHVSLTFGKINTVDMYAAGHKFSGGRGIESFQHLEFVAPFSGVTPPMIFGGIISVKTDPAKFTLMIYDPNEQTRHTGFENAFEDGITFNGSVTVGSRFFDKPGSHTFNAAYSTLGGTDFNDIVIPGGVPPGTRDSRWYFAYSFEQTLWQDDTDPKRSWGLFGQTALTDGNPIPMRWCALGGIGGTSPFTGREHDKFGLGLFYVGVSDDLKSALQPVVDLGDEYGTEIFYNFAVTPWFRLTADLQVIAPSPKANDTAVVGGLRAQLIF
jgi:porin